jgi:large subunit ribosomal protein L22
MAEQLKAKAILRNLDIAPRKVRRLSGLLKGLHPQMAVAQLELAKARSAGPLKKLILSAVANAKNKKMNSQKLVIESIRVDEGRTLKRTLARARGRATLIRKKYSHVTVELAESEKITPPPFVLPQKAKKVKAPRRSAAPPKPKMEETKEKSRPGFIRRVFSRKVI